MAQKDSSNPNYTNTDPFFDPNNLSAVDELKGRFSALGDILQAGRDKARQILDLRHYTESAQMDIEHKDQAAKQAVNKTRILTDAQAQFTRAQAAAKQAKQSAGPDPTPLEMPQIYPTTSPGRGFDRGATELNSILTSIGTASGAAEGGKAVQSVSGYLGNVGGARDTNAGSPGTNLPPLNQGIPILGQTGGTPGAMDLQPQAPVPQTPGMLASLQVSNRTTPTEVSPGRYMPLASTDRQINVTPNVLTAAQREELIQRRYEYAHDYNLKQGEWKVDSLAKLGNTYGGRMAANIVKAVGEKGEIPPELAAQMVSMSEYTTLEEQKRTKIAGFAAATQAIAVRNQGQHEQAMESIAAGGITIQALQSDRNFMIESARTMLDRAKIIGDWDLAAKAQTLQRYAIDYSGEIAKSAQAGQIWIAKYGGAVTLLHQQMADDAAGKRQKIELGQRDAERAADRNLQLLMQQKDFEGRKGLLQEEGDIQDFQKTKDFRHQQSLITLEANLRGEYALKAQAEGGLHDQALAEINGKYAVAMGFDREQANLIGQKVKAEMEVRLEELKQQGIVGDQAVKLIINESAVQRSQSADRIKMIGATSDLTANIAAFMGKREALDGMQGVVNQTIEKQKESGALNPSSWNTGTMMGYRADQDISKKDPTAILNRIITKSWSGSEGVNPNGDPSIFYDAAIPGAVSGDKILALDKNNGATYLDGKTMAGMWATASGFAAGATPEQMKKAADYLESYRMAQVNGGQLVPYSKGVTTAWANSYSEAFSRNILANTPYLVAGIKIAGQQLGGLSGDIRDPRTGRTFATGQAATTAQPAPQPTFPEKLNQVMGGPLGGVMNATLLRAFSEGGTNPGSIDTVEGQ